jgi:LacI family transcriptional regulator
LAALGLSVPQDVSVVGYDDDPLGHWLTPKLTSVRQPFAEMGQAAMELLRRRMADPASPVESKVLPVQLVQRESVAPPPALVR